MRVGALFIAVTLAGAFALLACKPKVGGACSGGPPACADEHTAVQCLDGKYAAAPCAGPSGCAEVGGVVTCDIRGDGPGAACLGGSLSMSCSDDSKSRYSCQKGEIVVDRCNGPKGCFKKTEQTMGCDTVPEPGDPCAAGADDTCAADRISLLECRSGKLVVSAVCRGRSGCSFSSLGATCDTSVGRADDACMAGSTCSEDHTQLLACEGGKLAVSKTCDGPKGCAQGKGTDPDCDTRVPSK
jgi:hypothetical protein